MSIYCVLLLLLSIGFARSAKPDYARIAEKESIRDRMMLLQPETVFRVFFEDEEDDRKLNEACARDLKIFEKDLELRQSWALRMLDSSSTLPPGLLKGNFVNLGMYDECISSNKPEDVEIRGRHCMYSFSIETLVTEFPIYPTYSICLPTSCDENDVRSLLDQRIQRNDTMSEHFKIVSTSCMRIGPREKGTGYWVAVAYYVVTVGFLLLCTLCDVLNRRFGFNTGSLSRFSVIKSSEKILSTETHEDEIRALHGIRVLSTTWIVLVHAFFMPLFAANINTLELIPWFASWSSLVPLVGVYCVDTFFVLSGFLMTYNFFKKRLKNGESFNVLHHYVHRYLRLTLPIVTLILSIFILMVHPLSGALYDWLQTIMLDGCRTKWWSVLTYTQNFVEPDNRCMQHLWFMSVDMQLFLISPLILYFLYKKPKIGLSILALLVFASIVSSAGILGVNRYSSIYLDQSLNIKKTLAVFDDVYQMPYTRASPWLLGVALGYKITRGQEKLSKIAITAGWLTTIICFAFVIFGIKSLTELDYEYDLTWEVIFTGFARPLWAVAICWMIYACHNGYAGPISTFLSWKGFVPLSKLCYCIYLVHLLLPFVRQATSRTNSHYSIYVILSNYVGDMVLSIALAFFTSIAYEIPVQVLDSLIFQKNKQSKPEK